MPLKVNLNVTFDMYNRLARYDDTSSYATNGYDPESVEGFLRITYPDGIVSDFFALTSGVISDAGGFSFIYPLRTDAVNEVMRGTYVFEYVVKDTSGAEPVEIDSLRREIDFDYIRPTLSIVPVITLFKPEVSAADSTVYDIEYFEYTIDRTFSVKAPSVSTDVVVVSDPVVFFSSNNTYYNTDYVVKLEAELNYKGVVDDPIQIAVDFTNDWFSIIDYIVTEQTIKINRGI